MDALQRMPLFEQTRQVLNRRRRIVVLALAIPLTAVAGLVLFMPRTYRSTAVLVVERGAGVSEDDLDARLSALKNENLSRARLKNLIRRFRLYQTSGRSAPTELLVDQMLKDVRIELDEEQRSGRAVVSAVRVTYTADDPRVAAAVTNELAAFYEKGDLHMREQRALYTRDKLQQELADARQRLDQQEKHLRDFKARHLNELPEQVGLHLAALERLSGQIRSSQTETGRRQAERDERLDRLRVLEARYTDLHPDVKRLKHEIAVLPFVPKAASKNTAGESGAGPNEARAEGVRQRVDELKQQAAIHEQGILNAPFRQQELEALLPDYVAARTRYQSLWEKYEIARLSDPRQDGGRLRILDSAVPRTEPVSPHLARFVAVGVALALAALVGLVLLVERMDTSFHTLDDLRSFTRVPVLATVPRLVTSTERRREARKARRFVAVTAVAVAVTFVASAYIGLGSQTLLAWLGHAGQ